LLKRGGCVDRRKLKKRARECAARIAKSRLSALFTGHCGERNRVPLGGKDRSHQFVTHKRYLFSIKTSIFFTFFVYRKIFSL
jgi:hypothetical protein